MIRCLVQVYPTVEALDNQAIVHVQDKKTVFARSLARAEALAMVFCRNKQGVAYMVFYKDDGTLECKLIPLAN